MPNKKIINILVITESLEHADEVKRRMQEAGHLVRVAQAQDIEDIDEHLSTPGWDLVMLDLRTPEVSVGDALELMRDKRVDASLLAICQDTTPDRDVLTLRTGARDVIPWYPEDYLSLVVDRELSTLYDRRAYVACRGSLAESEQRARMLLDSSNEAIGYLHEGMHIYANPAYLAMFGFDTAEEISGIPIMDLVKTKQHKPFKKFLRTHSRDGADPGDMNIQAIRSNGEEFSAKLMLAPACLEGEPCIQALFQDKGSKPKPETTTPREDLSRIDPLTKIYTSQYFLCQLGEASASKQSGIGVLLLSLDGFAGIRDKVGLAGADEVLKDTAAMLRESVGDSGWLARIGAENFAYVDDSHTTKQFKALAATLRKQIEDMIYEASGQSVTTTASIGVYPPDYDIDDPEAVLSRLEHCSSHVARDGGNGIKVYHPGGAEGEDEGKARLLQVKEALSHRRVTPLFQAVINLQGETHETYMVNPYITTDTGDRLGPDQYHDVARDAGLIGTLDKLLFSSLLKTLAERMEENHQPRLIVPLSEETLQDPQSPRWLRAHLKAMGMDGELLTIEIPEPLAVKYLKQMQRFIAAIKKFGCKTVLEIGNMPSAFHHLKQMDIEYFKIPANLIHDLGTQEESQQLAQELTKSLIELDKKVIAAGVRDANTMALLWEYGIDYVMGDYIHKPTEAMNFDFSGGG